MSIHSRPLLLQLSNIFPFIPKLFSPISLCLQYAQSRLPSEHAKATLGENLAAKIQHMPSASLEAAVFAAKQRYVERNPNSKRLYNEACESLSGGNTRTLLYYAPFPLCMKKGEAY